MGPRLAFATSVLAFAALPALTPGLARAQQAEADMEAPGPEQAPAPSDAPPPAAPTTRIAVILLATSGVAPQTADDLTEVLVSAVAERGGFSIVGKEEFQSQLGQSERGSLECIGSVACIGQVGVQLGVEQALAGTIALRDGTWVFNLNRIDVRSGDTVGRAFREVHGDVGAVATELQRVLPTLFEAIRRPATIVVSSGFAGAEVMVDGLVVGTVADAGHPVRTGDLPPGSHEVIVRMHGHADYRREVEVASGATLQLDASPADARRGGGTEISPLVWIGGGVAVAGGIAGLVFGLLSQGAPSATATQRQAESYYASAETQATIANVSFAVAGAGVLTALIGLVITLTSGGHDAAPAQPQAHLEVTPLAGGLSLGLGGAL